MAFDPSTCRPLLKSPMERHTGERRWSSHRPAQYRFALHSGASRALCRERVVECGCDGCGKFAYPHLRAPLDAQTFRFSHQARSVFAVAGAPTASADSGSCAAVGAPRSSAAGIIPSCRNRARCSLLLSAASSCSILTSRAMWNTVSGSDSSVIALAGALGQALKRSPPPRA